jgi:hypothetical protein
MKRKIIGITLMLILISSPLTLFANAGSEKNPELEDETGECLSCVDIMSAWFFEKPESPEYLYVKMKIKNIKILRPQQHFYVLFEINNKRYWAHLEKNYIPKSIYEVWYEDPHVVGVPVYGYVNKLDGVISWYIPKSEIRNPEVGAHITNIRASATDFIYMDTRTCIPYIILKTISKIFNIDYYDLYKIKEPPIRNLTSYMLDKMDYANDYVESNGIDYIIQY